MRASAFDPTIGATHVEVRVRAQHVTLIGPVTSGAQADDAERAVRAVLGVYSLDNQMWVP
ncbi:MAG: BON domain-containing protein [bacterium]